MDPFYKYHPGSEIASQLFKERNDLVGNIVNNPSNAIQYLAENYNFGLKTDFWDDFVFNTVISPALNQIVSSPDILDAIDRYSQLDHALFTTYIRRDEDPVRFRRAFWNVNFYGVQIAKRFHGEYSDENCLPASSSNITRNPLRKKIAFVFKGPFKLAHAEFFQEFLCGTKIFDSQVHIILILLDESLEKCDNSEFGHVEIVSLTHHRRTSQKLKHYYELTRKFQFDHITWIACVQNLGLFMGVRLAHTQSYWSMKYHSIIMESLDKYAGLGFGGQSFNFDDVQWFRGRAFPKINLPLVNIKQRNQILDQKKIPKGVFLIGCFVRSEKLNNPLYWEFLNSLFERHHNVHFALASGPLPQVAMPYIQSSNFSERFHHLGWVDTKIWSQLINLYLDSFPRGSCLTLLEAIKADVPSVLFDSTHNRESSALPYLTAAMKSHNLVPPGTLSMDNLNSALDYVSELIRTPNNASDLAKQQKQLLRTLEGKNHLFAKDYLNYFLNTNFSVNQLSS